MGEIFLAKQAGPSGFEKLLVIKRILSHHLEKADYLDMFLSEAKLVARLSHQNIIQIHEMGEIDGDYYIAMEFVRGKSLRDVIDELRAEGRMLPLPHVIELGIKLCEGLGYAHQARDIRGRPMNIVHRDINPHNVLISYDGDLKLIDFGIAKSEMTSVNTATGTIKGKFVYMSPEQSAADPIDRRSDIFSLGIVLYEMCCLENPFVRQNVVLSLEAIQRQEVPPPSTKRADAGPLDEILAKALAKKVEDRYQTAIDMRDELRDLFRTGLVNPAEQDLTGFLHGLFAADIAEEDRLLAEADSAARFVPQAPSNSMVAPAPASVPFHDEEPTVAGDLDDMAAMSRSAGDSSDEHELTDVPPEREGNVMTLIPPDQVDHGSEHGFEPGKIPTRSDRLPRLSDSNPDGPALSREAAFSEPMGSELSQLPVPPPAISHLEPTRELYPNQGQGQSALSGAIPPWSVSPQEHITDEDSGRFRPAPPPPPTWRWLVRGAIYASVLFITTVAGFLVTRAFIGPKDELRGVALVPLEDEQPPPVVRAPPSEPAALAAPPPTEAPIPEPSPTAVTPAAVLAPPPAAAPEVEADEPADDEPATTRKKRRGRKSRASRRRTSTPVESTPEPVSTPVEPPKPVVVKPVEPPPPPAESKSSRKGTLTVRTNQEVEVVTAGRSVGTSPSSIAVRQDTGTVELRAPDGAMITLRYEVQDGGLVLKVDADPWAIVKHDGIALGRTPRSVEAAKKHQFAFMRPGQPQAFVVSVLWNPKP
ncbi:MAG: serine/threonine protein kinase [Deltaproteobacteria bacterium]|nr:serine/threonine protein kinase [Deltaproteobacteria bacterium]